MLIGDEGQGVGIAVFFGFLQNRLLFWTQTTVVSSKDEFPGKERNADRLAEDRCEEEKERGDDTRGSYGESTVRCLSFTNTSRRVAGTNPFLTRAT